MKSIEKLTPDDILISDYNTLISIVEETNRAPGGYATVQTIANACFIDKSKRVLEIGTSTGNTAIELARMCKCQIESIDINERSVLKARDRAKEENLSDFIRVYQMDATDLQFDKETFDIVFCGNVTSLIPDRTKAFQEYMRVLKPGGFLVAVPMYYIERPSKELLEKVSLAIQMQVSDSCEREWLEFYRDGNMVLKYRQAYRFDRIEDRYIDRFIDYILSKPHLKQMSKDTYDCLSEQYSKFIYLFRENLSKMGFSILIYSKELYNNEPELFTAQPVII